MSNNSPRMQVENALQELQNELTRLGYWQSQMLEPERTNSTEPFCADTLDITEWLQWVFIPRMRTVVRNNMQLPFRCEVTPRIEVWTMESPNEKIGQLLAIMRRTDSLINRFFVG